MNTIANNEIRTRDCPSCIICGSIGELQYGGLRDRLFGAPGFWNFKLCSNAECSLIWLDPMPVDLDIWKAYKRYYTHRDNISKETWIRRAYRKAQQGLLAHYYGYRNGNTAFFDRIIGSLIYFHPGRLADTIFSVFYLNAIPHGRLLEVGCGSGRMLKSMQDKGWDVVGVDPDPIAINNAKSKGLIVYQGILADQKFMKDSFDAIALSHVIEHVPDPLNLLKECERILKPGGHLVLITPNINSFCHQLYKSDWRSLEPPRHLYIFNRQTLKQLSQRAGFKNIKLETTIRDANNTFIASRALQRYGFHTMGSKQPLIIRIIGRIFQFVEWATLYFNSEIGEEIVLIGIKTNER
jgi:2-polyprenyl-3-methyl-5-hydroxy-6-metoxy-1,4-benzoquinol methylase